MNCVEKVWSSQRERTFRVCPCSLSTLAVGPTWMFWRKTSRHLKHSWSCSEEPNISSRPLIGSEGAERRNKDTWDTFVNLCLLLICPEDITAETNGKTARVKTTGLNAVWTHFLFVTPASVDWRVGMLYSLTEWWQTVKKCNQNNVYLLACHRVWLSKEFYWCHTQIRFRCRGSKLDFVEMDWDWCWCESEGKPPHDFTSPSGGWNYSCRLNCDVVRWGCRWGDSMLMSDRIHDFYVATP